jgi:hypothetical protein
VKRVMRKKLLLTTILLPMLLSLVVVHSAEGSTVPTVSIEPAVIWNLAMGPGATFTLEATVDYVEKLWAYQVTLGEPIVRELIPGWDPSILHLIAIENGPFLGSWGGSVVFVPGEIDNTYGVLELTVGYLDPKMRFPTGGGTLMILTFEVVGYGCTPIRFGLDTGLVDRFGNWIMRGTSHPEALKGGFFCNVQGPELYIRRRGAGDGLGISTEWKVNLVGVPQTLYSNITNWGELGAWVKVKFTVVSAPFGVQEYWSDEKWLGPMVGDEHTITEVSATFTPPGPARYLIAGELYFKAEGMRDFAPYQLVIDGGGEGEAVSKSTEGKYGFKVVTKL